MLRLLLWRARVPLTVLAVLVSAVVVLDALRPDPEPRSTVLVAARELEAGSVLDADDVRAVQWPERLVPSYARAGGSGGDGGAGVEGRARTAGAASGAGGAGESRTEADDDGAVTAAHVVGRTLAVAVPEGLPLVEGVLASEEWWAEAPAGSVAAPVRLPDPELASLVRVGDRVDLYGTPLEGGEAEVLARRALVLAGPGSSDIEGGGLFGTATPTASALILVAVTSAEARGIASRTATAVVSAVLVQ